MKNLNYAILIAISILLATSCAKENDSESGPVPTLTTSTVSIIKGTSAKCGGEVITDNGLTVIARGVCWSTNSNPTIADDTTKNSVGAGIFTSQITGLNPKTQYFVRAYATSNAGTGYGSTMSFTTTDIMRGEYFQGGIVCYVSSYAGVTFGYIAAPFDQSPAAEWGCMGTFISDLSFTGQQNTSIIVNQCTSAGTAARLCADLVLNGYDDWYLPNSSEAQNLLFLANINLTSEYYWTSDQLDADKAVYAIVQNAGYNPYVNDKNDLHPVRAFRDFSY